jgi:hypothetical protein
MGSIDLKNTQTPGKVKVLTVCIREARRDLLVDDDREEAIAGPADL